MALDFDKYANDGNRFMNTLTHNLGVPGEKSRAGMALRAVLHALRDRITISESLHLLSQLPMFLKAVYVENWKYREKPVDIDTKGAFLKRVEELQQSFGESEFDWNMTTEAIVRTVIDAIGEYVTEGEMEDILSQLPADMRELIPETATS